LASRRQQFILFGVQGVVTLQQDGRELAGRDIDPPLTKIFEQAALGDMVLMNLQQDVLPQADAEMRIHGRGATRRLPSGSR